MFDRLTHVDSQKLQEKNSAPIDKATGRELFIPQTGRRPQTAVRNIDIFNEFHELVDVCINMSEALVSLRNFLKNVTSEGFEIKIL